MYLRIRNMQRNWWLLWVEVILWFNPCSAPGWDGEENWVRESVGTCELIQRQFTKQGKSFPCKQSETRNSFPVSHQQAGVPGKLRSSYIMVSKEDSNHHYNYLHFSFFARKLLSTAPCGMGCTLVVVVSCPDCDPSSSWAVQQRSPWFCASTVQQQPNVSVINTISLLNPKHSTIWDSMKKIISAESWPGGYMKSCQIFKSLP